jgi:hypothetical protein
MTVSSDCQQFQYSTQNRVAHAARAKVMGIASVHASKRERQIVEQPLIYHIFFLGTNSSLIIYLDLIQDISYQSTSYITFHRRNNIIYSVNYNQLLHQLQPPFSTKQITMEATKLSYTSCS